MPTPASDAPYGPHTHRVRRFLQRVAALTPEQWAGVLGAHAAAAATTAWSEADYHLGAAIEAGGLLAARDAVLGPVVRLSAARGEDEAGAEALLGAALALVAADHLDLDLADTLYEPFAAAVPRAALG